MDNDAIRGRRLTDAESWNMLIQETNIDEEAIKKCVNMDNYPEHLTGAVDIYLKENPKAKVFHYDYIKSTTKTTYRIYILKK